MERAYNEFKKMKPFVSEDFKLRDGMNYFEVTYITSLLYCLVISGYLILKSEGHSIRDHPVIARILEIKGQWDKLMEMSSKFPLPVGNSINHNNEAITKSNVENGSLEREACLVQEMAGFSKDDSKNPDKKSAMKKQENPPLDRKRIEMMKVRENFEAKLKQNRSYSYLKLVADKTAKDLARPESGNLVTLDDFDDEPRPSKHHGSSSRLQSLNKLAPTAGPKKNKWKHISGDEDVPRRDDIAERRRKHELRVLARAGVNDESKEGQDCYGMNKMSTDLHESVKTESKDEFYMKVDKQRSKKLAAKAKFVPREEPAFNDGQPIPRKIKESRDLKRYKKKHANNPRKKHKYADLQGSYKMESKDEFYMKLENWQDEKLAVKEKFHKILQYVPREEPALEPIFRRPLTREIEEGLTRYKKKHARNRRKKRKVSIEQRQEMYDPVDEKLAAKENFHKILQNVPREESASEPEVEPIYRRPLTREIEVNRGLSRYRKKHARNRRKKRKNKKPKVVIRRQEGSYGGEPGGIDINFIGSRKLC